MDFEYFEISNIPLWIYSGVQGRKVRISELLILHGVPV